MRVGVIGYGSIGSVLAKGFDKIGHDVIVNDKQRDKVKASQFDYQPHEWIRANADVAFFALPTPTKADGGDASIVDEVLHNYRRANCVCCLKSTMPPGTTQTLAEKHELDLVYCPEFLRDESTVDDFFSIDRLVLAGDVSGRDAVAQVYDHPRVSIGRVIETADYLTAEIGKEAHNAFFATKVSYANQIRMITEANGGDASRVMDIVTADRRNTTSHLDPMLGPYGGKCLPKDTEALALYAASENCRVPMLEGAMRVNDIARKRYETVGLDASTQEESALESD